MPTERFTSQPSGWTRRGLLGAGGAAVAGSLAGCVGSLSSGSGSSTTGSTETTTGSSSGTTTTDPLLGGHPSAAGLLNQPRWGPPPTEAEGVVIAFEDPSCSRCAAFETGTVPKLRKRLGDRLSFVFRSYPVVYPWGKPATQAVEATFAHEMQMTESTTSATETTTPDSTPYGYRQGSVATWALLGHYFEEQDQFDKGNVLDRTRTFLAEETDLDAEAVVADAKAKTYDDAVQADLAAGKEAGVGQTTPTVFLFRDGEFRTSAKGSISFQVVKAALGL